MSRSAHYWRGFVCLAYDLVPYVGALDDKQTVWTAIAYHGNGVAMGTWCGRAVARLLTKKTAREELPPVLTRRLARFPLPAFRPLYLEGRLCLVRLAGFPLITSWGPSSRPGGRPSSPRLPPGLRRQPAVQPCGRRGLQS